MNCSDDEFLERLACGDLDEADPAVVRRLAADPGLARRRAELEALLRELGAQAREERLVAADARALGHPRDAAFVRERLAQAAGRAARTDAGRARAARSGQFLRILVAAAVVVALLALARMLSVSRTDPIRETTLLSGSDIELLTPADGAAYDPQVGFDWRVELGPGDKVRLVFEWIDGVGRRNGSEYRVDAPPWLPTPEILAELPAECSWHVRVEGPGDPVFSRERRVSFSPSPR